MYGPATAWAEGAVVSRPITKFRAGFKILLSHFMITETNRALSGYVGRAHGSLLLRTPTAARDDLLNQKNTLRRRLAHGLAL